VPQTEYQDTISYGEGWVFDVLLRSRFPAHHKTWQAIFNMNRWSIPDWLEEEVKARDQTCVYCGIRMIEQMPVRGSRKAVATWEHIINDAGIVTRENIARCCVACNASKGSKKLSDWIQSTYCKERGINKDTVAVVVKEALRAGA
jgi:hypothetical protein